MTKGLIVFAREPVPGKVKTRLASSIGDLAASKQYEDMLQNVLKTTRQLSDVETVIFWDCEVESLPLLAEKYLCCSLFQSPGNLGQRMQAAFEKMFSSGFELCCIIGSDAPDLPHSYIMEAFDLLEMQQADAVFGPSMDGGYYLLGVRQVWPQLFAHIPWSSVDVLHQSLAAACDSGLTTTLLPVWQDIDTLEDLHAFQERNRLTPTMETT